MSRQPYDEVIDRTKCVNLMFAFPHPHDHNGAVSLDGTYLAGMVVVVVVMMAVVMVVMVEEVVVVMVEVVVVVVG